MSDFNTDLIDALNEIQNPYTDGRANYGKYATLSECLNKAKETLGKHHLAISQAVHSDPDRVVTSIKHISGDCISDGGVPIHTVDRTAPQKLGAAITYARRYGLCAILGIVGDEDDDAQSATAPNELPPTANKRLEKKKKPPAEPTPDIPMPRIVAEEIPFDDADATTDWASWVDEHIAGMAKHRDLAQHKQWSTSVKPQRDKLKKEDPKQFARLSDAYKVRRAVLTNNQE